MPQTKNFTVKNVSPLPESETEITGEISLSFLVVLRPEALKALNESASLPGFRPGKIPEDVLVKRVGEMRVLEETAEIALSREYAHIIEAAKVAAIGRPEISITKLAAGIPLEFKIKVAVEPEFKLPDYKKIAKEIFGAQIEKPEVADKEVEDVVEELKKRDIKPDLKEGEKLEDKIRENLVLEKEQRVKEGKRHKFLESIIKETDATAPKILIESEMSKMLAQFRDDVERMGIKWTDYLNKINKSETDIREEWRAQAVSRVKAELIINKIAHEEKIEPDQKDVEHETKHVLHHYPDADPVRAGIYVYTQLRNQKVFEFLETIDKTSK